MNQSLLTLNSLILKIFLIMMNIFLCITITAVICNIFHKFLNMYIFEITRDVLCINDVQISVSIQ